MLARDHRVFAVDLSGTGYSVPNPPFSAGHLASLSHSDAALTARKIGAAPPV